MISVLRLVVGLVFLGFAPGCGVLTDPATRLAFDIQWQVLRLGRKEGATLVIEHRTPSHAGQCTGPYRVQFDKVGALVVWCYDSEGNTISSSGTSYHSRFIETPRTLILAKDAGATLTLRVERRNGRPTLTAVQ